MLFLGDETRQHQPQPHLHILSERRPDDPPTTNHKSAFILPDDPTANQKQGFIHHGSDSASSHLVTLDPQSHHHQQSQIHLYLHHEELERMAASGDDGMVGVEDGMDTSGNVTGSDFDEDGDEGQMPFSELLSDPEKDDCQDPPSSTTGDHNEKPSKRSGQGKLSLYLRGVGRSE